MLTETKSGPRTVTSKYQDNACGDNWGNESFAWCQKEYQKICLGE